MSQPNGLGVSPRPYDSDRLLRCIAFMAGGMDMMVDSLQHNADLTQIQRAYYTGLISMFTLLAEIAKPNGADEDTIRNSLHDMGFQPPSINIILAHVQPPGVAWPSTSEEHADDHRPT